MGKGGRWSLKTDKKDETTPGPKYATDRISSVEEYVSRIKSKRKSNFETNYEQLAKCQMKETEKDRLMSQSPPIGIYDNAY